MAAPSSTAAAAEPKAELVVDANETAAELARRVRSGREILARPMGSKPELAAARKAFRTWDAFNATLLTRSFSTSAPAKEYSRDANSFAVVHGRRYPPDDEKAFRVRLKGRLERLESLVGQLPLYERAKAATDSAATTVEQVGSGVFIVHGRDEKMKLSVVEVVRQITGTEPVILDEQPDNGRTIIEKFEGHASEVGFAVVLLTGDDAGGLKGHAPQPRARQNVVFELGYFFGKLGRSRVAVLLEPEVELPSDVDGLLYIKVDAGGGWKLALGKTLGEADIEVDLNKLR